LLASSPNFNYPTRNRHKKARMPASKRFWPEIYLVVMEG
jgi:hypothetical protein